MRAVGFSRQIHHWHHELDWWWWVVGVFQTKKCEILISIREFQRSLTSHEKQTRSTSSQKKVWWLPCTFLHTLWVYIHSSWAWMLLYSEFGLFMISLNCFFFQGRMITPNTSLKTVKKTRIGCTSMNLHNVKSLHTGRFYDVFSLDKTKTY